MVRVCLAADIKVLSLQGPPDLLAVGEGVVAHPQKPIPCCLTLASNFGSQVSGVPTSAYLSEFATYVIDLKIASRLLLVLFLFTFVTVPPYFVSAVNSKLFSMI